MAEAQSAREQMKVFTTKDELEFNRRGESSKRNSVVGGSVSCGVWLAGWLTAGWLLAYKATTLRVTVAG